MSARDLGLIATKVTDSARIFATVSGAKGTEPIRMVGLSRITSEIFIFQQSPTCGRRPTSATSLHHLLTPTSSRPAPSASRIDVTFGASETIRTFPCEPLAVMVARILLAPQQIHHKPTE